MVLEPRDFRRAIQDFLRSRAVQDTTDAKLECLKLSIEMSPKLRSNDDYEQDIIGRATRLYEWATK